MPGKDNRTPQFKRRVAAASPMRAAVAARALAALVLAATWKCARSGLAEQRTLCLRWRRMTRGIAMVPAIDDDGCACRPTTPAAAAARCHPSRRRRLVCQSPEARLRAPAAARSRVLSLSLLLAGGQSCCRRATPSWSIWAPRGIGHSIPRTPRLARACTNTCTGTTLTPGESSPLLARLPLRESLG